MSEELKKQLDEEKALRVALHTQLSTPSEKRNSREKEPERSKKETDVGISVEAGSVDLEKASLLSSQPHSLNPDQSKERRSRDLRKQQEEEDSLCCSCLFW